MKVVLKRLSEHKNIDHKELIDLHNRIFGDDELDMCDSIDEFCGIFQDPYCLLVYERKKLIGLCCLEEVNAGKYYIYNTGLLRKFQQKGIMKKVADFLLLWLRDRPGPVACYGVVSKDNEKGNLFFRNLGAKEKKPFCTLRNGDIKYEMEIK